MGEKGQARARFHRHMQHMQNCQPISERRAELTKATTEVERAPPSSDNSSDDDHDYLCPITQEVMRDPVMASDGQTYEREAIEDWFKEGHMTSPNTNETLPDQKLIPNYSLKNLCDKYRKKPPETDDNLDS